MSPAVSPSNGSERGPVALPVFKIGRLPLTAGGLGSTPRRFRQPSRSSGSTSSSARYGWRASDTRRLSRRSSLCERRRTGSARLERRHGPRRMALSDPERARVSERAEGESKGQTPAPVPSPCFVYILQCCDGSYYVGCTSDLRERERIHNEGFGAVHTAAHGPVRVVYSEAHESSTRPGMGGASGYVRQVVCDRSANPAIITGLTACRHQGDRGWVSSGGSMVLAISNTRLRQPDVKTSTGLHTAEDVAVSDHRDHRRSRLPRPLSAAREPAPPAPGPAGRVRCSRGECARAVRDRVPPTPVVPPKCRTAIVGTAYVDVIARSVPRAVIPTESGTRLRRSPAASHSG